MPLDLLVLMLITLNVLTHVQILILMITLEVSLELLQHLILLVCLLALLLQPRKLILTRQQFLVVFE